MVMIRLSFACLIAPVVTTTSLASIKPANPDSPGKMAVKMEREEYETYYLGLGTRHTHKLNSETVWYGIPEFNIPLDTV